MSGEWVRRVERIEPHRCDLPMRDIMIDLPTRPDNTPKPEKFGEEPDGNLGDLWRCAGCGRLWRIARRPPSTYGLGFGVWRRARLWQRFRHRQPGRVPSVLSRESSQASDERGTR